MNVATGKTHILDTRAATATEGDPRWAAVVARDPDADGRFFYSVKTTGVYCRPSCGARLARPENVRFHASCEDAERAGFRACRRCKPDQPRAARSADKAVDPPGEAGIGERIDALDWGRITRELDARGNAVLPALLKPAECDVLAGFYDDEARHRSRVVMARHGFGRGEYKYFHYPLPDTVQALRAALYPRLVPLANRWNQAMDIEAVYPPRHEAFLARCHAAGQSRPTPLLLRYCTDDYNCLHQDLYGEHVFPLQVAVLLSRPGRDFSGGEFVLTEQRPRMQSRPEVVPLSQGDAVAFAVHHRPVQGTRGVYRVNMRHGVSRLHSGQRHALGVIFHDAA